MRIKQFLCQFRAVQWWGLAMLGRDGGSWKTQPDFSMYIIWILYTQITSLKNFCPSPSPIFWSYSHSLCVSAEPPFCYYSNPSRTDLMISNLTSVWKFYCAASLNITVERSLLATHILILNFFLDIQMWPKDSLYHVLRIITLNCRGIVLIPLIPCSGLCHVNWE